MLLFPPSYLFLAPPIIPSSFITSSPTLYASKNSFALHPPSGSDSSSSVGSSSGSLSRPAQLPLPAPVLPQPGRGFTVAPTAPLPATPIGGSAPTPASQSATTNCNINTNASFYIVPLDTTAIPPGSVLLNPQTGGYLLTNIYFKGWRLRCVFAILTLLANSLLSEWSKNLNLAVLL